MHIVVAVLVGLVRGLCSLPLEEDIYSTRHPRPVNDGLCYVRILTVEMCVLSQRSNAQR